MGEDSSDSSLIRVKWHYDCFSTCGFNVIGAFEVVLINLRIITQDDVMDLEETEFFDETYSSPEKQFCRPYGWRV